SQLSPFVDRARALGRDVAGNAAGKRELPAEPRQAGLVLADLRIDLAVGPFEVRVGDERRAAVPRTRDEDHVEVVFPDHPVQVDVNEAQARGRPPVSEQVRLDVRDLERLPEERILEEVELPHGEVVRGAPIGVHLSELLGVERGFPAHGSSRRAPSPSVRRTERAIISSSSVRRTRTATGPSSGEILAASPALRAGSIRIPRKPRPSQMRARTSGAFSPMPPAKTRVSKPPSAAANEPIHFFTW